METREQKVIEDTGALFGDLWFRYDEKLFEESVALFSQRLESNGFDLKWFRGKRCLDAGCGGGRFSVAMGRMGAAEVIGCDISDQGLEDARRRAADLPNVRFQKTSVLELPFPDDSFDFVCSAGVLHHTTDPEKGLSEITRVLKPGGKLYMLLYATGGVCWPQVMDVRPHAQAMGYELADEAVKLAKLPANRRRSILDDLFVPVIGFYTWDEIKAMLGNSYRDVQRFTQKSALDHESSVSAMRTELQELHGMFSAALASPRFKSVIGEVAKAEKAAKKWIDALEKIVADHAAGKMTDEERDWQVFGWGHHRFVAIKN